MGFSPCVYSVADYLPNQSLIRVFATKHPPHISQCRQLIRGLVLLFLRLSQTGIVVRDLHPHNIYFFDDQNHDAHTADFDWSAFRLIDFGICSIQRDVLGTYLQSQMGDSKLYQSQKRHRQELFRRVSALLYLYA